MTYLDNAATTLIKPREVRSAVIRAMDTMTSPGRGGHPYAMRAAETAFKCREIAARMFNAENPEHVVFTANATMGLNIAVNSLLRRGDRVLVTGYEHNSVMRALEMRGADITVCPSELFEPESAVMAFDRRMTKDVKLAVVNHVSNVFGYILPAERIGKMCRERGIPYIVDASQSAGSVKVDFRALGAEFVAMPGHKGLYGPQGTGILLCGGRAKPLIAGGTGSGSASRKMPGWLPDMLEAGTHNTPGIAGLSAGLSFVEKTGRERILEHEKELIMTAAKGLGGIRNVTVYASEHGFAQAGVLSFSIRGMDSETAGEKLAGRGIAVRAGLHCSPEAHKTAGTFETGTVRLSVSAFTGKRDIYRLLSAVEDIAPKGGKG
ncbi:MAG: aminotransferase class V-fold PLP-dependent enzyme [Oscillospiraceae bacterium]|nr:aminotransferase class V-fold PLP-dependent enzyme [Oscillospiraceae bacterium]